MKKLKSMKSSTLIADLVIITFILILIGIFISGFKEQNISTSTTIQSNKTLDKEQENIKDMVDKYKRDLDDKIVDFQVYRQPRDKHLFTLYDSKTNPNSVRYDHWIEYDIDTDSLVVNDYIDMDGSVEGIENEIKGEYSLAKGIPVSNKKSPPSHVTIKLYLAKGLDNSDIVKMLAEYKDGVFITNTLGAQGKKYKGKLLYDKEKDLSQNK